MLYVRAKRHAPPVTLVMPRSAVAERPRWAFPSAFTVAAVGHTDADDDARRVGRRRELHVVGGTEAAVGHLHHAGVGIGRRHARRLVLRAALLLGRGHLG